jgi:RNA polymerase sigma factor (sigma-70 family)
LRFIHTFRKKEESTEAALLLAYRQKGDVSVLGKLYAPYMELVFGICYKYLREEAAAKDAVMQIFEKLVTDLRVHEVANFRSWLHSVARNYCLMLLRSQRGFVPLEDITNAQEAFVENEVVRFDEKDFSALGKCMDLLHTEQKLSGELFYLQKKCYREISELTGFEIGKVKSFIQNGKRNLKNCLERNGTR